MKIPEMPDHPRFRVFEGKIEFNTADSGWWNIEDMGKFNTENYCCIAYEWWDEQREVFGDGMQPAGHKLRCLANMKHWRKYKKEILKD